jgi:hypothetical protein
LLMFVIGIAIYFLPIVRLLDSLTELVEPKGDCAALSVGKGGCSSMTVLPRPSRWGNNMAEVLKIFRETAFTPETIQILADALDEDWERLGQSGSRLARPAYARAMREVVAKRIIEMAQRGVEDREALVADALRFIAANYEQPEPRKLAK